MIGLRGSGRGVGRKEGREKGRSDESESGGQSSYQCSKFDGRAERALRPPSPPLYPKSAEHAACMTWHPLYCI